jgi:hypothetical protein
MSLNRIENVELLRRVRIGNMGADTMEDSFNKDKNILTLLRDREASILGNVLILLYDRYKEATSGVTCDLVKAEMMFAILGIAKTLCNLDSFHCFSLTRRVES